VTATEQRSASDTRTWSDPGNAYELYYAHGSYGPAGLRWAHQRTDGTWCAANFPFRGYGNGRGEWTIVLAEPLTVTPALSCPSCRSRGWLDGGKLRVTK
jgi:hypothetical protein